MNAKTLDVLNFDPLALNVVNRVAAGGQLSGQLMFDGGLLVQGCVDGHLEVQGCLVVWFGGLVTGRVKVRGDLYLFGQLGLDDGSPLDTVVECHGQIYVAQTGTSSGTLLGKRLVLYEGAELRGPFKTLRH